MILVLYYNYLLFSFYYQKFFCFCCYQKIFFGFSTIKKIYPSFSQPYSVPCLPRSLQDQIGAVFYFFLFLILLVPFSHKTGSSFNAILPIFHVIGAFATFVSNFKSLLPFRSLPFAGALSL